MTLKRLVLASASPRRLELLAQIGIKPHLVAPTHIDETPNPSEKPEQLVMRLACEKALASNEDGIILAADTIVVQNNRIFGKAATADEARYILNKLSGKQHRVMTAIAVKIKSPPEKLPKTLWSKIVTTKVKFKCLSPADIETYIQSNEWQGKAGAYAIQGLAGQFVKTINGSYTNIVGLPLYEVTNMLRGAGYDW